MNDALQVVAERPPNRAGLVVEAVDAAAMIARRDAWDRLVAGAAYPNPHFSRRAVGAHLESGLGPRHPRFLIVSRGDDLLALVPFRPAGAPVGLMRRASAPFASPYVTNTTPLVAAAAFEEALDALAGGLALGAGRGGLWRLPLLALDSAVGQGLLVALARRGLPCEILSSYPRAVLDRGPNYEEFSRRIRGRAKEMRRCRKRLLGKGAVAHRAVEAGPELDAAIEAFLALEQAGWKGARGTALACRPETASFARRLFGNGDDPVRPRADLLTLDGRPVAVSLALVCGRTGVFLKTTYDETLRSCAPGLLLEDDIVRAAHETGFVDRLDAATVAGSVMDRIYPDRETIADVLVSTRPGRELGPLVGAERRRQAARERLKQLVNRIRSR